METLVTVAVLLAMIALGAFLIHLLNGQHEQRIAAFHYSNLLPGVRSRKTKPRQQTDEPGATPTSTGSSSRADQRDGGLGAAHPTRPVTPGPGAPLHAEKESP
jgi:nitrogen fixation-related uncharacterized protein